MKRMWPLLVLTSAFFIATTIDLVRGQEPQPAAGGVYTAAQAQAGQTAYRQNCAGCHSADFRGSADAPAVAGPDFVAKWGPRAANELFTYLVQSMPPTNPGALGEAGTLAVTAYLLQVNGAPALFQRPSARCSPDRRRRSSQRAEAEADETHCRPCSAPPAAPDWVAAQQRLEA
jgi:mono/diheme cytochrome c family protein